MTAHASSHHLPALDAFRGLAIAGMILVNNPGNWDAVFSPLVHAGWDGCTIADLVFPSFLVILGIAMPFAFWRRKSRNDHLIGRVIRRSAALVALGLILNAAAAWPNVWALRIPGVLQRIGVVYLAAALITLYTNVRGRVIAICVLLVGHWLVLTHLPWQGHVYDLKPGSNIGAAFDVSLFGSHTLRPNGDPEGALSTASAIATALMGTLIGDAVRSSRIRSAAVLTLCPIAMIAAGWIWSYWLPLNKSLWTPSYALFAAGVAGLLFVLFHLWFDSRTPPAWIQPLRWLGFNPLAVYFGSELMRTGFDRPIARVAPASTTAMWLYTSVARAAVPGVFDDRFAALVYGALIVGFWTAVAGVLYHRGVRIQV